MRRTLASLSLSLLIALPLSAACTFDLLPAVQHPAGASPAHIETADFNNDGYIDVAARRNGTDTISILLGTSSGTFGAPSAVITGRAIMRDIATGDFNGDNKVDLVTTNGWIPGAPPAVNILLGKGDGTFHPLVPYTVFQNPAELAVADFDKDGKLDIAASKSEGFVLLLGLGNGEVVQKSDNILIENSNVGHDPTALTHGDFDGDGKLDVALSEIVSNRIHVFYGVGDGSFTRGPALTTSDVYGALALTAGDFDGDKDDDLAWGEHDPYGDTSEKKHVHIFISSGAGKTFTKSAQGYGELEGSAAMKARSADIDGDGDRDLLISAMFGFQILFNDGKGVFSSFKDVSEAYAFETVVADVDRDGGPDIVTSGFTVTGQIAVFRNVCAQIGLTLTSTPNPSVVDEGATFLSTVTPPPAVAPTGTVTLKRGDAVVTIIDLANTLSINKTLYSLPLGTHTFTATYSGDSRFAAVTRTITHVVDYGSFRTPTRVTATSIGGPVSISWAGSYGVTHYEVWRRTTGTNYALLGTTEVMSYTDTSASPSAAWLYQVRAVAIAAHGTTKSQFSVPDLASTFAFTDETVTPGVTIIRAVHLSQLRAATNAARALVGLQPVTWSNATPVYVAAHYLMEIREALIAVRANVGIAPATYTSTAEGLGYARVIRAHHVTETRAALR